MAENIYRYIFRVNGQIVHGGITKDLKRREAEHKQEYPDGYMEQKGPPTTEEAAREWEKEHSY